jgi:hypothetical protein
MNTSVQNLGKTGFNVEKSKYSGKEKLHVEEKRKIYYLLKRP